MKTYVKKIGMIAVLLGVLLIPAKHTWASSKALPVKTILKGYEAYGNNPLNEKETMRYYYNKKNLIKKTKSTCMIYDDLKWWHSKGAHIQKPKYSFYKNGRLKQAEDNIPWSSYDAGEAIYNKYGYITKRYGDHFILKFSYKKKRIHKIAIENDQGDFTEKLTSIVKYTYYKNKQVKTMSVDLGLEGKYKVTLNKKGYIIKIIDNQGRWDDINTYTMKYTFKKGLVSRMKTYVNGKLFRDYRFEYGKDKVSRKQYCSFINSMGALKTSGPCPDLLDIIQIFNLDNPYKNVF